MDAYESLMTKQKEIETIGQISGLLGWDQEVMMPPKAAPLRAEQLAWLSKTRHKLMIDPEIENYWYQQKMMMMEKLVCELEIFD